MSGRTIPSIFSTLVRLLFDVQPLARPTRVSYSLVSREWTRVPFNGPGPVGRYGHAVTMVGSKFFVFGGQVDGEFLNDMWAFDLNSRTFTYYPRAILDLAFLNISSVKSKPAWESYEPAPGNERPPRRTGHASVTHGDRIVMSVPPFALVSFPSLHCSVDLAARMVDITTTILGCSTSRREGGPSSSAQGIFRLPERGTLLPWWTMLCMSLVDVASTEQTWVI
jgi:hypothetical protein